MQTSDRVLVEVTCNIAAIVAAIEPNVARVAIANPRQSRLIAEELVRANKIDATVLARLYAGGFPLEARVANGRMQLIGGRRRNDGSSGGTDWG